MEKKDLKYNITKYKYINIVLNKGFTATAFITIKMMELFSYADIQKASRPHGLCLLEKDRRI
jgi:hypothetical protein